MIVATARAHDLPLATHDEAIKKSRVVKSGSPDLGQGNVRRHELAENRRRPILRAETTVYQVPEPQSTGQFSGVSPPSQTLSPQWGKTLLLKPMVPGWFNLNRA